VMCW